MMKQIILYSLLLANIAVAAEKPFNCRSKFVTKSDFPQYRTYFDGNADFDTAVGFKERNDLTGHPVLSADIDSRPGRDTIVTECDYK